MCVDMLTNIQVLDLSHDVRKIKALTGDHGEHFNRIVTEVEMLGQDCELCRKLEDELQKMKNHTQDALVDMQRQISRIQVKLNSEGDNCFGICSHLQDKIHLLGEDVRTCTSHCKTSPDTTTGQIHHSTLLSYCS